MSSYCCKYTDLGLMFVWGGVVLHSLPTRLWHCQVLVNGLIELMRRSCNVPWADCCLHRWRVDVFWIIPFEALVFLLDLCGPKNDFLPSVYAVPGDCLKWLIHSLVIADLRIYSKFFKIWVISDMYITRLFHNYVSKRTYARVKLFRIARGTL